LVNIQIPMNYLDHYLKKGSIRVYKNSSTTPLDVVSYDNAVVQYDFSSGNYTSDRVVGVRRIILENIYKLNTNDILSFKMEVPAFQSITIRPRIFIYAVN
nr:hypothetical protein [Spirosomataceae bacterium]